MLEYEDIYGPDGELVADEPEELAVPTTVVPIRSSITDASTDNPIRIRTWREVAAEIATRPPRQFLIDQVLIAGDSAVLAAVYKGGKTAMFGDATVSVASGTPWLGHFPCRQGRVLLFHGEDSAEEIQDRLKAICAHRGIAFDDVLDEIIQGDPLPKLKSPTEVDALVERIAEVRPSLVVIDPAYQASAGLDMTRLFEMGAALRSITRPAGDLGASVMFGWHTNRGDKARAIDRAVGAGPAEVARTLIGLEVKATRTDARQVEHADLRIEIRGTSLPQRMLSAQRRLWRERPGDLSSPMGYWIQVEAERDDPDADLHAGLKRLLSVLTDQFQTYDELQTAMAAQGGAYKPLKLESMRRYLATLADMGRAESDSARGPIAARWRRTTGVPAQTALGE